MLGAGQLSSVTDQPTSLPSSLTVVRGFTSLGVHRSYRRLSILFAPGASLPLPGPLPLLPRRLPPILPTALPWLRKEGGGTPSSNIAAHRVHHVPRPSSYPHPPWPKARRTPAAVPSAPFQVTMMDNPLSQLLLPGARASEIPAAGLVTKRGPVEALLRRTKCVPPAPVSNGWGSGEGPGRLARLGEVGSCVDAPAQWCCSTPGAPDTPDTRRLQALSSPRLRLPTSDLQHRHWICAPRGLDCPVPPPGPV